MIPEVPMELTATDVERYELGRFGDLRLQKRGPGATGPWLHRLARAFWPWLKVKGAGRLVLDGFYAIRR